MVLFFAQICACSCKSVFAKMFLCVARVLAKVEKFNNVLLHSGFFLYFKGAEHSQCTQPSKIAKNLRQSLQDKVSDITHGS